MNFSKTLRPERIIQFGEGGFLRGFVDWMLQIANEKTDFNGYSPSNFNDKYCGNISASESLAKSSNVCAVKILNYSGIDGAISVLNKLNIKTDESDKNLALALGATKYGATLSQITSAYNVFSNSGYYTAPSAIKEMQLNKNKIRATRKKEKNYKSNKY